MNEFNMYEYTVAQKNEGKWRVRRILLILGYIVFVAALLIIGLRTRLLAPLLALTPLAVWMIVFCTWRYVNVEYEYTVISGVFKLTHVFGGRSRKKILEIPIKDMTLIAPYNHEKPETIEKAENAIKRFAPEKEYVAISSPESPDIYYALCANKDTEEKFIIWFEATDKALKIFKFYNAPATVMSDVRY